MPPDRRPIPEALRAQPVADKRVADKRVADKRAAGKRAVGEDEAGEHDDEPRKAQSRVDRPAPDRAERVIPAGSPAANEGRRGSGAPAWGKPTPKVREVPQDEPRNAFRRDPQDATRDADARPPRGGRGRDRSRPKAAYDRVAFDRDKPRTGLRPPRAALSPDGQATDAQEGGAGPRMHRAVIDLAAAALTEVLTFRQAADRVLSQFFRQNPKMGQHDRALVAETVYAALRRSRLLQAAAPGAEGRRLVLATLVALRGVNLRELEPLLTRRESEWLAEVKRLAHEPQAFGVECDLPDWLVEKLLARHPKDDVLALARALQQPAPLDLRVNLARTTRDAAQAMLAAAGIETEVGKYSPAALRARGKPAIQRAAPFMQGLVEVQDEGSQLLAWLVAPQRGEMVVDFCAGAGGKTLALGMLMRSTGRLYAFDVSDTRLASLKPRLARSGLSNVHPQRIADERDPRLSRLGGKIDRVLVDAPCTGLGTLRRNPDLKFRQSAEGVAGMAARQSAILERAARLVKPGGRLVYATCSLLAEENEQVVEAFLAAQPMYALVPAAQVLARAEIPWVAASPSDDGSYLHLLPQVHGTDGFFAAVLERAK